MSANQSSHQLSAFVLFSHNMLLISSSNGKRKLFLFVDTSKIELQKLFTKIIIDLLFTIF